jgi:hypothetical protein
MLKRIQKCLEKLSTFLNTRMGQVVTIKQPVAEWADGTWCALEDLDVYITFKLGNFRIVEFDAVRHW